MWWGWWGGVIAGATSPEGRSGDPTTNAPGQAVFSQGQCCVVLPSFWCGNRFNGLRRGSASVTTRWIVACASVVREWGCGGGCGVSPRDLPEPGRWWLAHCQVHRGTTGASPPRIRWKLPAHHPVHTHQNQTPAASAAATLQPSLSPACPGARHARCSHLALLHTPTRTNGGAWRCGRSSRDHYTECSGAALGTRQARPHMAGVVQRLQDRFARAHARHRRLQRDKGLGKAAAAAVGSARVRVWWVLWAPHHQTTPGESGVAVHRCTGAQRRWQGPCVVEEHSA